MHPTELFEIFLVLLAAALVLSLVARRIGMPPAAAYVIGGVVLAFTPGAPRFEIDPEFALVLFLPPLLLESAYFTVWRDFKANLRPIMLLAVGAVVFTTLTVGLVAHALVPTLPLAAAFCLGAIVSPPDAVAAKAVLQGAPVPARLVTILEGESLVNDASGLMLYRLAVSAALTGSFSWTDAALTFGQLTAGGVALGAVMAFTANAIFARLRESQLVTLTSFLVAYVTYIVAERAGASGVLSVVTAGLIMGWRQHALLGAQVRLEAQAVWRTVVFVMEALVFILIGLALRDVVQELGGFGPALASALPFALAVTLAVVAARFVWVFPATYLPRLVPSIRARDPSPPLSIPFLVGWAGIRGGVSLAAALALPLAFPGRDILIVTTFVVIAITVIVQGAALGPLARWLDPRAPEKPGFSHLDEHQARARIYEAALGKLLDAVDEEGNKLHPRLIEEYRRRVFIYTRNHEDREALAPVRQAHFDMAHLATDAARDALLSLHRSGAIHDSTLHAIEAELDLEESRLHRLSRTGESAH